MRYTRHIALLTLMLLIAADFSFGKGEARFHNGEVSGTAMTPDIRPLSMDVAEVDLVKMVREGPAEATGGELLPQTGNLKIIPSAVSRSPQKISRKARKRQKRKPFRIQVGKRQLVAFLLSIFLGILGIHRFYLGYYGIALIQMLTLGGLLVWFIVDAFRIGLGKLLPSSGPYTFRMGKQEEEE